MKKYWPVATAFFCGWLYLRTIAPGLTWAYDGADGGDFLAAVATDGVPHPSGYPTYLLFLSLFARLPLGSLAFRANLFSGLCMAGAILVLYKLTLLLSGKQLVAGLACLLFGTFPLIWSQALITEVYALQTLLSFIVLLCFIPGVSNSFRDLTGGLAMGLALGAHLTSLFLLPFMLFDASLLLVSKLPRSSDLFRHYVFQIIRRIAGLCVGLSVYLIIPLRARTLAPVNWGRVTDWDSFWWLASGRMYHGRLSYFSPEYILTAVRLWSRFLLDQMGVIGLSIGLIVLIVTFKPERLYLMTGWLFLVYSIFAIVYYSPDSYVYLIPVLAAFAIWISFGIWFIIEKLPPGWASLKPALVSIAFLAIGLRAVFMIPQMDISNDHSAEHYAETVLSSLPQSAMVVTQGDEAMFSLWYYHYALAQRPDVAVISADLLSRPWYHAVLHDTYPTLNVADTTLASDFAVLNPGRPLCLLGTDLQPKFECLQ